ncbi:NYN domain-containing protein [Brachybacterium squillarum]|uniref:NYN domain-containing protein n=1 Tax=Brachybacterium squillarum TaxID=661979 RepID=UPI0022235DBF|nr:NYN domain-containing protein [Brachybacterium squillarum]MCW1803853.1 NYN domain-containing protein [Brachybacterium squillarum]
MPDPQDPRVAVYLDFDNIVMSWYDRVHGRHAFSRDRQRIAADPTEPEIADRLARATVDFGAIIDHATSFGSLMLTRAYADWSAPINADYRAQLVARAVDLVQLFPAAAYAKNGADIRLAVDAVEDMFRIPALTHVVIVGGDSDYVPLAQRCRRLGRYVVGLGVAGSTAKSLAAACDQFDSYETLPGVELPAGEEPRRGRKSQASTETSSDAAGTAATTGSGTGSASAATTEETPDRTAAPTHVDTAESEDSPGPTAAETAAAESAAASRLLARALQQGERDDAEWMHLSMVKTFMRRMDPSFSEKALGYRSFSEFLLDHEEIAEMEESGHERLVRPREQEKEQPGSRRSGRRSKKS